MAASCAASVMTAPLPDKQVPSSFGCRMPAEWHPRQATWLAWPHNRETWPGPRLDGVIKIYLNMLEILLSGEKVHLLVRDAGEEASVRTILSQCRISPKNLSFHLTATQDAWIRDYGPLFVRKESGEKAWCKASFNGWGGKYERAAEDDRVFEESRSLIPHPCFKLPAVVEGGSIEVNGEGTALAAEQSLLNPNRNPGMSRETMERHLKDYLGISCCIWLDGGLEGDDTDGHVDNLARFTAPDVILSVYEEDPSDENHSVLKSQWARLREAEQPAGRKWNLVKFPAAPAIIEEGRRLPASYANYYLAANAVLVPAFGDPRRDDRAQKILKEHFPNRSIAAISCRDLVYGLGALHCITQQEPVGTGSPGDRIHVSGTGPV